ncbi:MAG: riboflavin synthase [Myxococcota bacterium]
MFTGLITDIGTVQRLTPGAVTDVWIDSHYPGDFSHGESIACDGVCLTVVESKGPSFRVQAAPETLRRSTLSRWTAGTHVNLERALRLGDRLGGHWVQGHVDGVASILGMHEEGGSLVLRVALPDALAPFFVEKGSVCIDGVSLTVTGVDAKSFSVMLIPETQTATTLGRKHAGDEVNLEADVIGKYVARMMGPRGRLTEEQLKAAGFTP